MPFLICINSQFPNFTLCIAPKALPQIRCRLVPLSDVAAIRRANVGRQQDQLQGLEQACGIHWMRSRRITTTSNTKIQSTMNTQTATWHLHNASTRASCSLYICDHYFYNFTYTYSYIVIIIFDCHLLIDSVPILILFSSYNY